MRSSYCSQLPSRTFQIIMIHPFTPQNTENRCGARRSLLGPPKASLSVPGGGGHRGGFPIITKHVRSMWLVFSTSPQIPGAHSDVLIRRTSDTSGDSSPQPFEQSEVPQFNLDPTWPSLAVHRCSVHQSSASYLVHSGH